MFGEHYPRISELSAKGKDDRYDGDIQENHTQWKRVSQKVCLGDCVGFWHHLRQPRGLKAE